MIARWFAVIQRHVISNMARIDTLSDVLGTESRRVNVVLFSQPGCEFCAEEREHYLKPLAAERRRELNIVEVDIEATKRMRDWRGRSVTQSDFAAASGARFAPTVMFLDASGKSLAEPIVGLSRDFFGVYLDQRIAAAIRAAARQETS